MSRENVEMVRRAIEAFNGGDVEALKALTAKEVEIVPLRAALEGTVYRGESAAQQFWSNAMDSWSELHVKLKHVHDLGDLAVATGILRGRARETGMELEAEHGWMFAFRDGLITQIRTCRSEADAFEAARASARGSS